MSLIPIHLQIKKKIICFDKKSHQRYKRHDNIVSVTLSEY